MVEEIRELLTEVERLLSEADNVNDHQCNDMTLSHLKIALEWQKRKIKKPPDDSGCECSTQSAVCGRKEA